MLSDSQGKVLKFIADRPPLAQHLGEPLLTGRRLTREEISAPLPSLIAPSSAGVVSPMDILRAICCVGWRRRTAPLGYSRFLPHLLWARLKR